MRRLVSFFVLFSIAFSIAAQKNEVILTIEGQQFTKDEFVRIYKKNNSTLLEDSDKKTPEGYMDLFINFRLKVIEAENLKYDTIPSFINELASYRKELAAPYLTDVSYNEQQVEDTYQRMKTEVRASHILVGIPGNQTPDDTLQAFNKIMEIRSEILGGMDFRDAARKYSEDPSAKSNMGDLGYFSAFQMVYPFEEAAFSTNVGEISMPVRSNFGYHILKVVDKRNARGELKVAHIMKSFPPETDNTIMKKLRSEIDSIYKQLKNGVDFAELAKKYSDDKSSAANGGELAWFSSGRMITDFAEPAFALQNDGDISEPIVTQYGYHIIKRLAYRPVKSFEDLKPEIERRIKNDPARSVYSKTAFIAKLKKEYGFQVNENNFNNLKNNTSVLNENNSEEMSEELFVADNIKYNLNSFISFVKNQYPTLKEIESGNLSMYFNNWVEKELTDYEDSKLEEKYPDFRYLMQEYHDGILLFNISDEKIWSYASKDSAGLEEYYNSHKGKYLWGERFKGTIIRCRDIETRNEVDNYFSDGLTVQEIRDIVNKESDRVVIEEGIWEENSNAIINYYVWDGEKPDGFDDMLEYIRGDMVKPEAKLLNEARGLYLSDYQVFLEEKWVKQLRSKYDIKVNRKLLKSIKSES
ncbi:MAG: peptidylprolyl isomerase [Prolixibacteraceae bacterium]|nr:peptidylprolyl isomerase [Prolixibacteraceae bacterium]